MYESDQYFKGRSSHHSKKSASGITYSNLLDSNSQADLARALEKELPKVDVDRFLEQVTFYNDHVPTDSLVQSGYGHSKELVPGYDVASISEKWFQQFPNFSGFNCRLTAFSLLHSLISVKNTGGFDDSLLFTDKDAIASAPKNSAFTDREIADFKTLFGAVATDNITDTTLHSQKVQAYWKQQGVEFHTGNLRMISVWFHDQIDPDATKLFIGHVGVLVPAEEGVLFIEKISFEDPYQVLKFANAEEVVTYLMDKYDVDTSGSTKPFLMENDQPLLVDK
ncbi:DUF4300 family protein [Streptococcus sp. X13SY08]|uniref:DUF4300 family protein n=1 Tax=Streptococcus sp. X13SY08 TaxID=1676616 RepID=UPI0006A797B0|nr:DUF4300 family protein [Streptococcus sp. X13SY08]